MTYQQSFHVDAPVAKVFDFFKDPENWARLAEGVDFKDIVVTPQGLGTHYSWAGTVAGVTLKGFNVFTEFVPNRRITDRSSSRLEGTWTYSFEPQGTGTKLTVENRVDSSLRLPLLEPFLDWATRKTHEPRFERLSRVLGE